METHEPLPGVQVGDIGRKLGYNSVDNGFLLFDNVRVPRSAHLSRFTEVTEDGNFEIKADPRILYSGMTNIRLGIIFGSAVALMRSARVAVRYAVCRRQFANQKDTREERKLLDYQVHMDTLSKNIANGFILTLTAGAIADLSK